MAVLRELLWICALLCLTTGQTEVTARAKEHAVLQCQSPAGGRISVLKWSRPGLKSAGYVYFYRNNRRFDSYQHPSFHGRVKLRQPDMRDGDATLILSNVTEEDAGKYECYVSASGPETSCFINLIVTGETSQTAEKLEFIREEPGGDGKDAVTVETSSRLVAAVVVAVVVVVVLVSVGLWRVTRRRQVTRQHAPVKGLCEAEEQ